MQKLTFAALTLLVLLAAGPFLHPDDTALKPEALLARHLDSIGSLQARSEAKTRVVQGTATFRVVVGGGGKYEGKTGLVSEGQKVRFMMKFNRSDYIGENFLFNGDAVQFSFANASQSRSPMSGFVSSQDVILRDGLLGGVLSTAWPLLDLDARKGKLVYEGQKKVDGQQVHQFRYEPRKHYEAQIRLYFDAETFRHVKTVYIVTLANNVGADVTAGAKLQPERSTLEERFGDFKTVDGLTLPTHWNLQFTRELPDGSTSVSEWDLHEDQIQNNLGLDPRNFQAK